MRENLSSGVSDLVRHKPACRVRKRLEEAKRKRDCTFQVVKTNALTSFAVTAQLIWVFVFAYANSWFSHEVAHILKKICFCIQVCLAKALIICTETQQHLISIILISTFVLLPSVIPPLPKPKFQVSRYFFLFFCKTDFVWLSLPI